MKSGISGRRIDSASKLNQVCYLMMPVLLLTALTLASCRNELYDSVKSMHDEALSPRIVMNRQDKTTIDTGSSLDFGQVTLGSSKEITLTITNSGKRNLEIDPAGISTVMDDGTETDSFVITEQPPESIPENGSGTLTIKFEPVLSIGTKSAAITIQTNDSNTPVYTLKLTGSGTTIPAGISAASANHQVTISWPDISNVASYNLYWSTSANPTIATANKIENAVSPYTHSGLANNTNYYYILTAMSSVGESEPSEVVSSKPMQIMVYVNSYNRVNIYPADSETGALGTLISGPALAPARINSITIDKARKYAYMTNVYNHQIFSYKINADSGELSAVGSPVSTGSSSFPRDIVIDSTSGYVYVVNSSTKNIMGYQVNFDGSLTSLASGFPLTLADEQINGVTISPNRPFIYFSTLNFHIYSYSINTGTGVLSPLGGSPLTLPCNPGPIAMSPSGETLYVTNQSNNNYTVNLPSYPVNNSSGLLGTVTNNPINRVSAVSLRNSNLAADPTGRFLFVGNYLNDNSLTVFRISNGSLTVVSVDTKDSLPINYEPGCMAVDSNGHCLYVGNGSKIESYSIDQTSGLLTWLSTTETFASGDNNSASAYPLIRDITVASLP